MSDTPVTKLEQTPQHERSEKVRLADIAAVSSHDNAKNLATNQGVFGHVKKEVDRSELATAHAMAEVFEQFNQQLTEATAKLHELHAAFEEVTKLQGKWNTDVLFRLSMLECRWWERLMRDLEWDVYGILEWIRERFKPAPVEVLVDVGDGDVVDIGPYLDTAGKVKAAILDDETVVQEFTMCACNHMADQHQYAEPSPCIVEGCGCSNFIAVGSTLADSTLLP